MCETNNEVPVNEATVNDTPVNEAPVNEALANEATVNEATVNDTPVNEATVKASLEGTKQEKKAFYKDIKQSALTAAKSSTGILIVYLLIFTLVRDFGLLKLGGLFWNLILKTASEPFITDKNLNVLLESPQVIVVGILLIFCYLFFALWELSGVYLCMEAHYQNKAVKLFPLFYYSLVQIRHVFKKGSFVILGLLFLALPLTNLYSSSQILNLFSLPEFISDTYTSKWWGILGMVVLYSGIVLLLLRTIFAWPEFFLRRKTFFAACKESTSIFKGHYVRFVWEWFKFLLVRALKCIVLPFLILAIVIVGSIVLMWNMDGCRLAIRIIYLDFLPDMIQILFSVFLEINCVAFYLSFHHHFVEYRGEKNDFVLPEKLIKTKGHIFRLRHLYLILCAIVTVGSFGIFCLTTAIFTHFPNTASYLLSDAVIIGHKGYSSKAPENTLDAFEAAYQTNQSGTKRCAYIELDVRTTKDNVVVVIHNSSILEATGKNIDISQITYSDLKKLCAHYNFPKSKFPDTYIPTLEEVLTKYDGKMNFLIELKTSQNTSTMIPQVVAMMQKHKITKTSLIHSGDYNALEKVKELDPTIKCGYIVAAGFGTFYDLPAVDFVSIEHTFLTSEMIYAIHRENKQVYVWTINRESSMEDMKFMGVDAIITDHIDQAYEILHSDDEDIVDFFIKVHNRLVNKDKTTTDEAEDY